MRAGHIQQPGKRVETMELTNLSDEYDNKRDDRRDDVSRHMNIALVPRVKERLREEAVTVVYYPGSKGRACVHIKCMVGTAFTSTSKSMEVSLILAHSCSFLTELRRRLGPSDQKPRTGAALRRSLTGALGTLSATEALEQSLAESLADDVGELTATDTASSTAESAPSSYLARRVLELQSTARAKRSEADRALAEIGEVRCVIAGRHRRAPPPCPDTEPPRVWSVRAAHTSTRTSKTASVRSRPTRDAHRRRHRAPRRR